MSSAQRIVKVFVSSTFRDTQEERDLLVKRTFPELRHRCRQRHIESVKVDLRWGSLKTNGNAALAFRKCIGFMKY